MCGSSFEAAISPRSLRDVALCHPLRNRGPCLRLASRTRSSPSLLNPPTTPKLRLSKASRKLRLQQPIRQPGFLTLTMSVNRLHRIKLLPFQEGLPAWGCSSLQFSQPSTTASSRNKKGHEKQRNRTKRQKSRRSTFTSRPQNARQRPWPKIETGFSSLPWWGWELVGKNRFTLALHVV